MNEILAVEPLVDGDQLGKILGVNRWTVQKMRKHGRIPFHQLRPRIFRYRVSEVLEALKK